MADFVIDSSFQAEGQPVSSLSNLSILPGSVRVLGSALCFENDVGSSYVLDSGFGYPLIDATNLTQLDGGVIAQATYSSHVAELRSVSLVLMVDKNKTRGMVCLTWQGVIL